MRRQATLLLLTAMGAMLVLTLAACGGGSTSSTEDAASGERYEAEASLVSLEGSGWQAVQTEGFPDTYAGVPQTGYLEATAPDGEPIDLQFFESPEDAQSELEATEEQEAPFEGATIGNVLVFDPASETAAVAPENLEALRGLLS